MDPKMHLALLKSIKEVKEDPRFEYNNHGEPSLHPEIHTMIKNTRLILPKSSIQIQSNIEIWYFNGGIKNVIAHANQMFRDGLNIFALNGYRKEIFEDFQKNEILVKKLLTSEIKYVDFYYNNPDKFSIYHKTTGKYFVLLDDLMRANLNKSASSEKAIVNQAGSVLKPVMDKLGREPLPKEGYKKACSRPHREITFGWNGTVSACCYDWKNGIVLGKFPEMSVREIWNSKAFHALRYLMSNEIKNRNLSPCDTCDYKGGWRLGFLPKIKLVEGEKRALEIIREEMKPYLKYQYPGTYHVGGVVYNTNKKDLNEFVKNEK